MQLCSLNPHKTTILTVAAQRSKKNSRFLFIPYLHFRIIVPVFAYSRRKRWKRKLVDGIVS
jgi:hypothetical protein